MDVNFNYWCMAAATAMESHKHSSSGTWGYADMLEITRIDLSIWL